MNPIYKLFVNFKLIKKNSIFAETKTNELIAKVEIKQVLLASKYEELAEICENIFKEHKSNGKVIEGIVIRTMYSNKLSCKYMNAEYDSKK